MIGSRTFKLMRPSRCCFAWPAMENRSPASWIGAKILRPPPAATVTESHLMNRGLASFRPVEFSILIPKRGLKSPCAKSWSPLNDSETYIKNSDRPVAHLDPFHSAAAAQPGLWPFLHRCSLRLHEASRLSAGTFRGRQGWRGDADVGQIIPRRGLSQSGEHAVE